MWAKNVQLDENYLTNADDFYCSFIRFFFQFASEYIRIYLFMLVWYSEHVDWNALDAYYK